MKNSIVNSVLIGISETRDFKVNENVKVRFGLFRTGDYRKLEKS